MQKLATELINRGVILRQENALVGRVQEVIINPADGKFMGFLLKEGFGKERIKALAEKDILGLNDQYVLIASYGVLGDVEDIVRINEVTKQKIPIIKNKVYTLSGTYLGKIRDFSIDLTQAKLSRLYVIPVFLKKFTAELIIESKCIVSIKKDRVVVDDSCVQKETIKVSLLSKKENPAANSCELTRQD
jgi:uncharacterized protein YrrD